MATRAKITRVKELVLPCAAWYCCNKSSVGTSESPSQKPHILTFFVLSALACCSTVFHTMLVPCRAMQQQQKNFGKRGFVWKGTVLVWPPLWGAEMLQCATGNASRNDLLHIEQLQRLIGGDGNTDLLPWNIKEKAEAKASWYLDCLLSCDEFAAVDRTRTCCHFKAPTNRPWSTVAIAACGTKRHGLAEKWPQSQSERGRMWITMTQNDSMATEFANLWSFAQAPSFRSPKQRSWYFFVNKNRSFGTELWRSHCVTSKALTLPRPRHVTSHT